MDTNNFKQLIEQGKTEEAQKLFEDFLQSEISDEEQGRVLVELGIVYMELENSINRQYLEILQNAIAALKDLKKEKTKVDEDIDTEISRKTIENS